MYNTSACQADSRYVMAIELGEPKEGVGVRFTMRFVESSDLRECRALSPEHVFSKDRYTACPAIRYLNCLYYMIYLESSPGPTWEPHIVRSSDLSRGRPAHTARSCATGRNTSESTTRA